MTNAHVDAYRVGCVNIQVGVEELDHFLKVAGPSSAEKCCRVISLNAKILYFVRVR